MANLFTTSKLPQAERRAPMRDLRDWVKVAKQNGQFGFALFSRRERQGGKWSWTFGKEDRWSDKDLSRSMFCGMNNKAANKVRGLESNYAN